jgi:hypothetical protein
LAVKPAAALAITLFVSLSACAKPPPLPEGDTIEKPVARDVQIYAAVITHMIQDEAVATASSTVYVLDSAREGAGDPHAQPGPATPLAADVQAGIQESLAGMAEIQFVAKREDVIGPSSGGSHVQGGAMLISLGPVQGTGDRAEVPANSYVADLASTWQTWVVVRAGEFWRVTGATGPLTVA